MRCPHRLCSQPVVVDHHNVGWCSARHRVDAFPLAVWRMNEQIERMTRELVTVMIPAFKRTARAFSRILR